MCLTGSSDISIPITRGMDSEPDVHTNSHIVVSAAATDIVALAANFNSFVLDLITLHFCCTHHSITLILICTWILLIYFSL